MRRRTFLAALLAAIFAPPTLTLAPEPRYLFLFATTPALLFDNGSPVKFFPSVKQSFSMGASAPVENEKWRFVDGNVDWYLRRV